MVKAIVGANWGDEGKGKITDMMAETADYIVRYQGGANAGHTIVNGYGKFVNFSTNLPPFFGFCRRQPFAPLRLRAQSAVT